MEKIVVIGSGPAAYSAALYSLEHNPVLFEGELVNDIGPGGQLTTTTNVDNFPGFPKGVQGPELMDMMKEQALKKGIKIISETVNKVRKVEDHFELETDSQVYKSKGVIVATGASARRLSVPGTNEGEFWQKGISACAVCDGFFFKDGIVAIIGGGDTAMEETQYMSNIAKKVYLIHRRNEFRARADKVEYIKSLKNVEIITPAVLVSAHGTKFLEYLVLENVETKEKFELKVNGLFFAIGHIPNTWFLEKDVSLNENGYIKSDERMHTSVQGLFACGDVQDFKYRQAITAASSGCIAGTECSKYVNKS